MRLRVGLATRLSAVDEHAEAFEPYAHVPPACRSGSQTTSRGRPHPRPQALSGPPVAFEALWWWQYSYFNQALHAVVAHASLDVAEESTL